MKRSGGVNYGAVMDKRVDDARHEREKAYKESQEKKPGTMSSTFDAFQRMAAGLEPRTLADNMSNPNRPTWEQYKKDNEDKLDLVGTDMKKMAEYRAQLDRERESRLSGGKRKQSSLSDSESDDGSSRKKSKKKKSKKEHKKSAKKEKKKSHKKSKDHKRHSQSSSESSSGGSSDGDEPVRLSDFLRGSQNT